MNGGARSGRERTAIWRARRAAGEVVVSVRVSKRDVAALVRARLLPVAVASDRRAVAEAVEAVLDRLPR